MDLKKVSYRTRMRLLPLFFVGVVLLIYWLALKKTVELSRQVSQQQQRVEQLSDAPLQIQLIKRRLQEIQNRIGSRSGSITQEEVFRRISSWSKRNALVVREFPEPHQLSSEDYLLDTYSMEVEGRFKQLLRLVHHLEQDEYIGKLASLKFQLKTDRRSREEYLTLRIFLQTVN